MGLYLVQALALVANAMMQDMPPPVDAPTEEQQATASINQAMLRGAREQLEEQRRAKAQYVGDVAAIEEANRRAKADYDGRVVAQKAAFDQEMAVWREKVRRCEAGEFAYCAAPAK